jgi:cytochrome c551
MRLLTLGLVLAALTACGKDETGETGPTTTTPPTGTGPLDLTGDATNGGTVFGDTCAVCHGADGSGVSGPALTGKVGGMSDEDLVDVMLSGTGSMPAQSLTNQEAADVLAYLRATFG